jgi:DNA-binding NtrC family response regulator
MSLSAQAKVLRALQENKITRVGGEKDITVDVRVIAATNKDLRAEIAKGNFREDLSHRLAVIIVKVPSLNERSDDIPDLVQHFITQVCEEYNTPAKKIEPTAVKLLQKVNWTGNIRELRNVVERLIILSGTTITAADVELFVQSPSTSTDNLQPLFDKFQDYPALNKYMKEEFEKYKTELV